VQAAEVVSISGIDTAPSCASSFGNSYTKPTPRTESAPKSGIKRKIQREDDDAVDDKAGADQSAGKGNPPAKRARTEAELKAPSTPKASPEPTFPFKPLTWKKEYSTVYFTGFRDPSLAAAVKAQGASVATSFTKAVNLLVTATATTQNADTKKAAAEGIDRLSRHEVTFIIRDPHASPSVGGRSPSVMKAGKANATSESRKRMMEGEVVFYVGFDKEKLAHEQAQIVAAGGTIAKSYSKAVTMIVAKYPTPNTAIIRQAHASGVRVVNALAYNFSEVRCILTPAESRAYFFPTFYCLQSPPASMSKAAEWSHRTLGTFTHTTVPVYGRHEWSGEMTVDGTTAILKFEQYGVASISPPGVMAVESMVDGVINFDTILTAASKHFLAPAQKKRWLNYKGIKTLESVRKMLHVNQLKVQETGHLIVSFAADFEEEHGAEVLWHDGKIIASGSCCEL
jgi:hypothetical protein